MLINNKKAFVIGHADGDGHLAAQQSKENLIADGYELVDVLVDPSITKSYRFWESSFDGLDFEDAGLVVVVDIRLSPKTPKKCLDAIRRRADVEPTRQFFIVDHHELDFIPDVPANVEFRVVDSVYECCYGKPTELMLIASVCDKDEEPVREQLNETFRIIAKGVNRAAAERKRFAGEPILKLIENRYWNAFESLANEPNTYHRTMYGNRVDKVPQSPILQVVEALTGGT